MRLRRILAALAVTLVVGTAVQAVTPSPVQAACNMPATHTFWDLAHCNGSAGAVPSSYGCHSLHPPSQPVSWANRIESIMNAYFDVAVNYYNEACSIDYAFTLFPRQGASSLPVAHRNNIEAMYLWSCPGCRTLADWQRAARSRGMSSLKVLAPPATKGWVA